MRHSVKRHRIGRGHAHRKATLAALTTALITHKRIRTTLAKAKALRGFAEPLLNRSKEDSTQNRRLVFKHLQDKKAVTELFEEVSGNIGGRMGGYTRILKLGPRDGDGAEMALIELVDYNDVKPSDAAGSRTRRRTRRGSSGRGRTGSTAENAPAQPAPSADTAATAAPAHSAPAPEPQEVAPVVPETPAVDTEDVAEEAPSQQEPEQTEDGEDKNV